MSNYRLLVVGVGSIGERHLRCFLATGRVKAAICEVNPDLRRAIADRYSVTRCYASLDDALIDTSWRPDAAVIATPAPLHIPMAARLAEAGVHLLIEKPLSTTTAGIPELQQLVNRRGLVAMVAFVLRAHPAVQAVRQVLAERRFGQPVELVAASGQHFPTYRPAYRSIYYRDRAMGGGAIQDALTHLINAAELLVGPADRVMADAAHQVLEGVEVEDVVHVVARHGHLLASYSLNQFQAPMENALTVVCERGTVRIEFHESRWRWMTEPGGKWHDEPVEARERDTIFITQANAFLACVETGAQPLCSLEEAFQTLRVNLSILQCTQDPGWRLTSDAGR